MSITLGVAKLAIDSCFIFIRIYVMWTGEEISNLFAETDKKADAASRTTGKQSIKQAADIKSGTFESKIFRYEELRRKPEATVTHQTKTSFCAVMHGMQ